MRAVLLALLLAASCVQAEESAAAPLVPVRLGYAFDDANILLRQRIFGLAHGVHLLLSGCLDKEAHAAAAQQAYETWHAAQRAAIDQVRRAVAAYHFGPQAERAQWQDIATALGLKETIYPALGAIPLAEACATLPQALAQPRYDFATQIDPAHEK